MYASLEREIADLENKSWDPAVVQKRRAVMQTQGFKDFAARFNLQNDLDTAFRLYLRQAKKELREQTDLGAGAFHKAAKEGKVSLLPSPEDYEDMAADDEFERTLTARGRESGQRAREDRLAREDGDRRLPRRAGRLGDYPQRGGRGGAVRAGGAERCGVVPRALA
jgi:hypothetical protein